MGTTSFLPRRESDLVTWTNNFDLKINATPTLFGLSAAQAEAYTTASTAFIEAYKACNSDTTNSRSATVTKNDAKKALIAMARQLAGIVQKYPGTTDTMRADLGLTIPLKPTPVPAPTERPLVGVSGVDGSKVTCWITGQTTKAKPAQALSAFIYACTGETYSSDPADWLFQGIATKATFEVTLPDAVPAGSQVWICAAWANRRGETGPVSLPVSTHTQSGAVNSPSIMKLAA
ncbi:MAG: hypothetical protein ACTHM6_13575 [Tepidisphaeraceae bacterium]